MIPTCDVQLSLTCLCSLDLGLGQGQKKVMQPGLAGREAASPGPTWGKAPRISRLRESNNKTGVCSGAQKEWKREKMEHESGEMVQIPSSMCLWELHLYPANSTMFSPVALFPASPPSVHSPPMGQSKSPHALSPLKDFGAKARILRGTLRTFQNQPQALCSHIRSLCHHPHNLWSHRTISKSPSYYFSSNFQD